MNAQERLRAKLAEIEGYKQKSAAGTLTNEDMKSWTTAIEEGHGLQAELKLSGQAETLAAWGNQPAQSLPLAGKSAAGQVAQQTTAQVDGFVAADDDEGMYTEPQFRATRSKEYKASFRNYLRRGFAGISDAERKTLSEGTDQAGGFLVPEEMINRIIQKAPTPTRVAGLVSSINISRDSVVMPKVSYATDDIYTTGVRATWTGEIPTSSTAHRVTDPVFGQTRIPVYTAMLSMPLTNDLVEDSIFPLVTWASGKFSETNDLLRDNMIINGTGIGQPAGILMNPNATDQPATVVSSSAAAIAAAGLIDIAYSVPEQYEDNLRWVFNKTNTAKTLAGLKDGNNRYLWGMGVDDSGLMVPAIRRSLLGYPVVFSGFMPNQAANAYPIIFGDLGGYMLVNRVGFSIQVLRELYAETNQIVLLGRVRFGGATIEPWRLKIQKCST